MTNHDEQPPRRHLHPVEPPYDPEYDNARTPPTNNDAEQAVLGALLTAPELAPELETHLDPDDFYRPAHEHIWTTIHHIAHTEGITPDVLTVAAHLQKTGELQRIGGAPYLHTLIAACPIPGQATHYAALVRDTARLRRLQQATTKLQAIVNSGRVDELEQTFTRAYEELDDAAARIGPRTTTHTTTSWRPLDLGPVLAGGEVDPPPAMLARTDGRYLLYDHAVHSISGEPTSGKTWFALLACAQQLDAGNTVTMLDFEDRASRVVGRLLALGAHPDAIRDRFRYVRPHAALDQTGRDALTPAIRDATLVILDGVTEAMTLHGLDLNANSDVASFLELLPRWIADHGPAVLMIDHVVKDTEKQGRWSIGGQHKLAGIDGVSYNIKAIDQFGRGKIGHARITAGKDRAGHVEEYLLGRTAGELWLDARNDTILHAEIRPPQEAPRDEAGNMRPTHLMERVSRYIELTPGLGKRELIDGRISGKGTYLRRAIDRLIQEGYIEVVTGPNKKQSHRSVTPFREDEDAMHTTPGWADQETLR